MSEFEKLKAGLQDKCLDYYEDNQSWIETALPKNSNGTLQQIPLAYLVLGAITVIEPKLKEFLEPFSKLNQDPLALMKILDLDIYGLDSKIRNRKVERAKLPKAAPSETDEIERIRQQLSKGEI
jgi:hypothetical protein